MSSIESVIWPVLEMETVERSPRILHGNVGRDLITCKLAGEGILQSPGRRLRG